MSKNQISKNDKKPSLDLRTRESEQSRTALLNMIEDVEESRKKAEEAKEETLAIINNFADGLLVFDIGGKLSLINSQAENFFGIRRRDIISRSILELRTFPALEPLMILIGEETKGIFRKELPVKENLILEVTVVSMAEAGKKLGSLVILHNITREKIVEKMKTEFVSLSAHQLRTPLSAIKWTLRILLDGDLGELTSEQKNFLEKIYQSNERMVSLINDLLNVTRIEEGRYLGKLTLVNIEEIIQLAVNSCKDEIERRKIKLEFKKPEEKIPQVMIDVEKIGLVVQNLIDNAVHYTRPGGEVLISLNRGAKDIEFSIKDVGVGIPKEQQERIFTKFFRGANAVKMEADGTGLGLFIAKNIINAHKGNIWFESEEGKGSTFHFTLPVGEK